MRVRIKSQHTANILMGIRDPNSPQVGGGSGSGPEGSRLSALLEPTALPVMKEVVVNMPDSKQMVEEAMMAEER